MNICPNYIFAIPVGYYGVIIAIFDYFVEVLFDKVILGAGGAKRKAVLPNYNLLNISKKEVKPLMR